VLWVYYSANITVNTQAAAPRGVQVATGTRGEFGHQGPSVPLPGADGGRGARSVAEEG